MKMNYEAPITELIYFRSEDILWDSVNDDVVGDESDENIADLGG